MVKKSEEFRAVTKKIIVSNSEKSWSGTNTTNVEVV